MSKKVVAFEPVFGGIVALLATAFLCFVFVTESSHHTSYMATAFLAIFSVRAIAWGVAQVLGYRKAQRDNVEQAPPVLGSALGCILLGLMFALVTVLLYEVAPTHQAYTIVSGIVAALLLFIGAAVGIRQGVWR